LYFFSLRHWSLFFFWDYVGIHVFNFESAKNLGDPGIDVTKWGHHNSSRNMTRKANKKAAAIRNQDPLLQYCTHRCMERPSTLLFDAACNDLQSAGREASFHQDLRAQMIKLSSQKLTTET
jgi:hypothetical protein